MSLSLLSHHGLPEALQAVRGMEFSDTLITFLSIHFGIVLIVAEYYFKVYFVYALERLFNDK